MDPTPHRSEVKAPLTLQFIMAALQRARQLQTTQPDLARKQRVHAIALSLPDPPVGSWVWRIISETTWVRRVRPALALLAGHSGALPAIIKRLDALDDHELAVELAEVRPLAYAQVQREHLVESAAAQSRWAEKVAADRRAAEFHARPVPVRPPVVCRMIRCAPRRLGARRHRRAATAREAAAGDDSGPSDPPPPKTVLLVSRAATVLP